MAKTMRDIAKDVIKTYGNMVKNAETQSSLAHEIVEGLISGGFVEEDEPNFIENETQRLEKEYRDNPNQERFSHVAADVQTSYSKTTDKDGLTASDRAHLAKRAQEEAKNKKASKPKTKAPKKAPEPDRKENKKSGWLSE